jgi:hypothetical protein
MYFSVFRCFLFLCVHMYFDTCVILFKENVFLFCIIREVNIVTCRGMGDENNPSRSDDWIY